MSVRKLSEALQKVANEELNEDPLRIESDLSHIKEWLKKQPHLNACTDDQFLLSFLRGTKFSLEKTKNKLDMFYTLRTVTPEIYSNRQPSSQAIQTILDAGSIIPLPKLPYPGSPRYVIIKLLDHEKFKFGPIDFFKLLTMIHDINILEDDNEMVAGLIGLQDFSGTTLATLKWAPLSLLKKCILGLEQAYPYRVRGMYFFNVPTFMDTLLNLIKQFLSEKNKKRINVYSNLDDFCKTVPLEILPEEYGGQGGKVADIAADWKKKLLSYENWFIEDEKRKSDESKRIGEPKTEESVFGIQGSFRQLAVD